MVAPSGSNEFGGPERPCVPVASRARWAVLAASLGTFLLAGDGLLAAEREDNYSFFREEAARRGTGSYGGQGSYGYAPIPYGAHSGFSDRPRLRLHVTPRKRSRERNDETRYAGGSEIMCVRTCDGYAFPIRVGKADGSTAESVCKANCPGAPTQVFTRRPGADLDTAVSADKKKTPYSKLTAAGLFQKSAVPACQCRPPSAVAAGPVYDDPTLRKGDMIVLEGQKIVVFKGDTGRPFDESDFTDASRSTLVSAATRKLVDERFTAKKLATIGDRTDKRRGRQPLPDAGTTADASAQAFAPAEPGKTRIILPAPFEAIDAKPPLDLSAVAQGSSDKGPGEKTTTPQ